MKRTLPNHVEAEASVLGGILLRNELLVELPELEPDDFYDARHAAVFSAMRNLEHQARPIDVVTLERVLSQAGRLESIGGPAFLGELCLRVPTVENVVEYAGIVGELSEARKLMLVASEIAQRGYDPELNVREYLDGAEAAILRVCARSAAAADALTVGELAKRRFREFDDIAARRQSGETALTGVPTGIASLDSKLGGWPRGVVSLLAARPAMGKSATSIAGVDAATSADIGALVFSLEDSWRAYADRTISRGSGVAADRLRQADIGKQDASLVARAVGALQSRTNWLVDDRGTLTVVDIARAVRRARTKIRNLGLVVVDYVQLVQRARGASEHEALDQIIGALAALAKDEDIAMVVCSQLNRKLEERIDKRPQMSDLRGSGGLEEKAKVIVGLYRGSVYGGEPRKEIDYDCWCPSGAPAAACPHKPNATEWERQIQYLLLKNNQGQTGRVFGSFIGPTLEVR